VLDELSEETRVHGADAAAQVDADPSGHGARV
jgi:hypothetical protein